MVSNADLLPAVRAELERRREMGRRATGRPWKGSSDRPLFGCWGIRQDPKDWDGNGYQAICAVPASYKGTHYGEMFRANRDLITAAANSWDAILDTIEALVEMLEHVQQARDPEFVTAADVLADRAIERLRAWVEAK